MASTTADTIVHSLISKMETMKVTAECKKRTLVDDMCDVLLDSTRHTELRATDECIAHVIARGVQVSLTMDVLTSANKRKLRMGNGAKFMAYTKAEFETGTQLVARSLAQTLNFLISTANYQVDRTNTLQSAKWRVSPIPPHQQQNKQQYVTVVYPS